MRVYQVAISGPPYWTSADSCQSLPEFRGLGLNGRRGLYTDLTALLTNLAVFVLFPCFPFSNLDPALVEDSGRRWPIMTILAVIDCFWSLLPDFWPEFDVIA